MLSVEKLMLVQLSMDDGMTVALAAVTSGLTVPARDVEGFGWFGRTFFETDGDGTCRLTVEGSRLAQTQQVEVPVLMRDVAFIARCAFLNGRQSALLRSASEGHTLAADGSEDADALYLQRCRLVRFDPYHDMLYASASGYERLMLSDGDDAQWMTEQGLAAVLVSLGFSSMSDEQRRRMVSRALRGVDNLAEYMRYPLADDGE